MNVFRCHRQTLGECGHASAHLGARGVIWVPVGVTPVLICADPEVLSVLLKKNVHLEFIVFLVKLSVIVSFSNVPIGFLLWSECFCAPSWPFSGFRVTLEHCWPCSCTAVSVLFLLQ